MQKPKKHVDTHIGLGIRRVEGKDEERDCYRP